MFSKNFFSASGKICTYSHHVNAPYLRREFEVRKGVREAKITVTSTGFYKFFLNGAELTKDFLSPYITNPDECLIYDTYDVTDALKEGTNCLGFVLGNGMVNCIGGYIWDFEKVAYRSAPAVAFSFEIAYGDGESCNFEADESMHCAPSPVTFDDLRSGTHVDARLRQDGWNLPGFDDGGWTDAVRAETPRGEASPFCGVPVLSSRTLTPIRVTEGATSAPIDPNVIRPVSVELSESLGRHFGESETGRLFDFGENVAGVLRIRVKGRAGQKLAFQFAEYLDGNGHIHYENIAAFYPQDYCQRDEYICRGDEEGETCLFPFTYHGGRWCLVSGLDEDQPISLEFLVIHAALPHRGDFSCSDETANRLQENVRRSALSNLTCFPTDCPHREKNGWTGDAAMSCEYFTLNFGMEDFFRQWLLLARKAQRADGAVPGIVPTGGWGFEWGNGPVWDSFLVELPYITYLYRGDTKILAENADMIFRYLGYLSNRRREDGLIDIGLGDWCQTGKDPGNPDCPTLVSDSIMCASVCERAAFLFDVLGMPLQKEFAYRLGADFREAVRAHLVDFSRMLVRGNTQCGQAMALYYGIFEEGERPEAYRRLVDMIHAEGDRFNCGMIGVRVLFHVLADFGDAELAYRMITRTDYPSYGMWIKEGLTSLPETFTPKTDMRTGSLNHHFMGDISNFFMTKIAGLRINPHKDDPARVLVQPNFVSCLDFATADYLTVGGKIGVTWRQLSDGKIAVAIEKAEGVRAELSLPFGYAFADAGDAPADLATSEFPMPSAEWRELIGKSVTAVEKSLWYLVEKKI